MLVQRFLVELHCVIVDGHHFLCFQSEHSNFLAMTNPFSSRSFINRLSHSGTPEKESFLPLHDFVGVIRPPVTLAVVVFAFSLFVDV